jgi:peptidoglycan/LPS O-acetylase OafA/YrhL
MMLVDKKYYNNFMQHHQPDKLDWINLGRGIAILMVIFCHTGGHAITHSFLARHFTDNGGLGVQLFFLLSSYTLVNSHLNRQKLGQSSSKRVFYLRRFFRIAPLYYLAALVYAVVAYYCPHLYGGTLNISNVLANVFFVNSFYFPAINYLPPGGWSIGAEMFFYLLFPFIMAYVHNLKRAFYVMILLMAMVFVLDTSLYYYINHYTSKSWAEIKGKSLYMWFPNQFPVFGIGIFGYYWISKYQNILSPQQGRRIMLGAILAFIGFCFFPFSTALPNAYFRYEYVFSLVLLVFMLGMSLYQPKFLGRIQLMKLGEYSFSVYLSHFLVINLYYFIIETLGLDWPGELHFVCLSVFTIVLSYHVAKLSYRFIETRGNAWGSSVIKKLRN